MSELELADESFQYPVLNEQLRFEGAKWSVWSDTVDIDGHVVVRDVLRHPGAVAVAAVRAAGVGAVVVSHRPALLALADEMVSPGPLPAPTYTGEHVEKVDR